MSPAPIAPVHGLEPLDHQSFQDRAVALASAFAASRGDVEVAYAMHDSPVGELLLARTPRGLVRVAFAASQDLDAVLSGLATQLSPRVLAVPERLEAERRELDEYFAGRRTRFAIAVDLALAHAFRREVLDHLREVPFGTTVSYAELASASGRPRAVRAAASACATNPVPIVVPCHRVIRGDGSLGGYLGGLEAKRTLLALESADGSSE